MAKNPWNVGSILDFLCFKCPECDFNNKKDDVFKEHATKNHPLSSSIFGKTCREEEDLEPILKIEANLTDIKTNEHEDISNEGK